MDLLITVSKSSSVEILGPLLRACVRRRCSWQVFLTHEGVKVLENADVAEILESHSKNKGDNNCAIVCHDSWQQYGSGGDCPVTAGSQTNHSEMAGAATRVVSL